MDINKLTDGSKDIWSDIKQIKQMLNEINEIKRKLSILNRLPKESDFTQLKHRVDVIENVGKNQKKRINEIDNRLKVVEGNKPVAVKPDGDDSDQSVDLM